MFTSESEGEGDVLAGNGNGDSKTLKAALVAAISSVIVSVVGNTSVALDARAARDDLKQGFREQVGELRTDFRQFGRLQCGRDELRDKVIIQALKDAKRRVKLSAANTGQAAQALAALDRSIDQLETFGNLCREQIPEDN
jgi:hypothetical protein